MARRTVTSRPALELLAESLEKTLGRVRFGRTMYWQSPNTTFSRPVRWLLALWGDEVVPAHFAGVAGGQQTVAPRGADVGSGHGAVVPTIIQRRLTPSASSCQPMSVSSESWLRRIAWRRRLAGV